MKRLVTLSATVALVLLLVALVVVRAEPKVYFVPLEAEPELLQSLKAYYQHELGLEIEILPSLQLSSATWNGGRRQASAERIIELIDTSYPQLKSSGIVIGITGRDMYIEDRPWTFGFSLRRHGRIAIVSHARMDPLFMGRRRNAELMETRLRKMVSRNIGILKFGLPQTADRHDLMYQDVLGIDDLDTLTEDLSRAGFPGARNRTSEPVKAPDQRQASLRRSESHS